MSSSVSTLLPSQQFWGLCRKYLWERIVIVAVASYMVFSVALYAATDIDICIPCLVSTIFGVECPGCGLTTAVMHLARFDFSGAWESNPMVFIVLPAGIISIYLDIKKFLQREKVAV